jgi:SPP1 family predicted phage head-tail adaptor
MRADMRTKITLLQLKRGYDDEGEPINDWQPVPGLTNLWAAKEPLLGREFFAAEQTQSRVEVKFRTHYVPGVKNEMRVQDSEGTYEILSAINVKSLNRELLMYCRQVRN